MSEKRTSVCNLCEAICGLELTVENGEVTGVRGNPADPLSRGHICPKGVAIGDLHGDPDRLRRPVRRIPASSPDEPDTWQELDWDTALDLVADGLARTINDHGRHAVALYLGNPTVHSLGAMTHATAFASVLRTHNTFSATSVDQLPHQLVAYLMYGHQLLLPIPDIDHTSYLLVVGGNPMASNGSLMTVPDFPGRLRELHARGGRMVVLDPRRTETAKVADEHHFVRPGSDAYVLLAMLHTLLHEDGLDLPLRLVGLVRGWDAARTAIAAFTPERAAAVSRMPAADIRRVARDLAAAGSAAAYGRVGVSTQELGTVCQWAIQLLNLVTGNLDARGGTAFTSPAADIVGRQIIGRGHRDAWRSRVRGLPEFGGELPVSVLREEIETPGEGQIRALVTHAGNPVLSTPDGDRLAEAIEGLDFYVAVDLYLNETTRYADVVLPPTSHLERDHYDLIFHALAVRDTARFAPAVFPPGPDQRHDWQIFGELTRRLWRRLDARPPLTRRLPTLARMAISPTRQVDLLLRTGKRRLSVDRLRRRPDGVDLGALETEQLERRLPSREGGRGFVDAAPDLVMAELERLASRPDPAAAGDGELLLIGRRHQRDNNSWMHNTPRLTRGRPRHHLLMHPADLAERGLEEGATVTVRSRVGAVRVEVTGSEDMMPGVVSLPHGYGHAANPGMSSAAQLPGVSVNDLTDPDRLDVSGNAVLNGVPVRVEACDRGPLTVR